VSLLERARVAGLTVWVVDGQLALEGPEMLEELAQELLAAEAEVIGEFAAERTRREAEAPWAVRPTNADPDNPPSGWVYLRTGELRGCWVGPDGALAGFRVGDLGEPGP